MVRVIQMFNKNKKLDSKVRFQRQAFKQQLRDARSYKREERKIPERSWEVFLSDLGLGTWKRKIGAGVLLGLLVYLIYAPNIFLVKNVIINGSGPQTQANLERTISLYLRSKPAWPQNNLLLLSKNGLKNYILKNDLDVISVNSINKKLTQTLIINVQPRLDAYLLKSPQGLFTISNDGVITGQIAVLPTSSPLNNLKLIDWAATDPIAISQPLINAQTLLAANQIQNGLPKAINAQVEHFGMNSSSDPELTVYTQTGLKILFDAKLDINKALNQLATLVGTLAPADVKRLLYIDMRFDSKAFVCYKGTACEKRTVIPTQTTASSSPDLSP